jgi:hypothetical protein
MKEQAHEAIHFVNITFSSQLCVFSGGRFLIVAESTVRSRFVQASGNDDEKPQLLGLKHLLALFIKHHCICRIVFRGYQIFHVVWFPTSASVDGHPITKRFSTS